MSETFNLTGGCCSSGRDSGRLEGDPLGPDESRVRVSDKYVALEREAWHIEILLYRARRDFEPRTLGPLLPPQADVQLFTAVQVRRRPRTELADSEPLLHRPRRHLSRVQMLYRLGCNDPSEAELQVVW